MPIGKLAYNRLSGIPMDLFDVNLPICRLYCHMAIWLVPFTRRLGKSGSKLAEHSAVVAGIPSFETAGVLLKRLTRRSLH